MLIDAHRMRDLLPLRVVHHAVLGVQHLEGEAAAVGLAGVPDELAEVLLFDHVVCLELLRHRAGAVVVPQLQR